MDITQTPDTAINPFKTSQILDQEEKEESKSVAEYSDGARDNLDDRPINSSSDSDLADERRPNKSAISVKEILQEI